MIFSRDWNIRNNPQTEEHTKNT